MSDRKDAPLSARERVCLRLILLAIKIMAPWRYEHEFRDLMKHIEAEVAR